MNLRLTDIYEEQVLWRELQLAASASADVFVGAVANVGRILGCSSGERSELSFSATHGDSGKTAAEAAAAN